MQQPGRQAARRRGLAPRAPATPPLAESEDGASVEAVYTRLRGSGFSRAQIEGIVQTLTTDGFIYSTIDEQHYRATS